jgi:hypothetical protein
MFKGYSHSSNFGAVQFFLIAPILFSGGLPVTGGGEVTVLPVPTIQGHRSIEGISAYSTNREPGGK